MDVRIGLWRRLSAEELMCLNCGVGEDSWESLGLQGDPTSAFWRRSALGFLWRDWCWSWNSSTLATSCEELTHWKRLLIRTYCIAQETLLSTLSWPIWENNLAKRVDICECITVSWNWYNIVNQLYSHKIFFFKREFMNRNILVSENSAMGSLMF